MLSLLEGMEVVIESDTGGSLDSAMGQQQWVDSYGEAGSIFLGYFRLKESVEALRREGKIAAATTAAPTPAADSTGAGAMEQEEEPLAPEEIVRIARGEMLSTANDLLDRLTVLRGSAAYAPSPACCPPGQSIQLAVLYDVGTYLYKLVTALEFGDGSTSGISSHDGVGKDIDGGVASSSADKAQTQALAMGRRAERELALQRCPVLTEARFERAERACAATAVL